MNTSALRKGFLKILILLSTLYAMAMVAHWPIGFTLFTQLSNLYVAAVVAAQLAAPGYKPLGLIKYTATVSITVTFLVYLLVLAPMDRHGFWGAYAQDHCASLCLHFITPLLTVSDFLINDAPLYRWEDRYALYAVIPPVAYFAFVLILGALGFRWWGMTGPYPFLNYEAPAGWFGIMPQTAGTQSLGIGVFYVIVLMIVLILLLGRLLLAAARRRARAAGAH